VRGPVPRTGPSPAAVREWAAAQASPYHLEAGSPPMSSPSTRPPNPGDDAISSLWLGVRRLVSVRLLPAGPNEGGVAAVFRRPAVRVTTMPEGDDREHDCHHRQGHGCGGEDAPARRAHGEIVLTPGRGVKAAMNVPTVRRRGCPGTVLACLVVAAWWTPCRVLHERAAACMKPVPGQG